MPCLYKKQTSVAKYTSEAEIVSLDHAVYKLGLPALSMWQYMLDRRFFFRVMEDIEAANRTIISGHNPNTRHVSRTQRIGLSALNERYHQGDFMLVACPSQFELAVSFRKLVPIPMFGLATSCPLVIVHVAPL